MHRVDNGTYFTSDDSGDRHPFSDLTDDDLRELYRYPDRPSRPWVRANFVSSLDGAATVDGKSGGLGSDGDRRVFGVLRELADAVVVGAGTVRAENYGGVQAGAAARRRRLERGASETPPIVVVTGSADLDPSSRLFTDTATAPIVLTGTEADERKLNALEAAGADVVRADSAHVSSAALLDLLAERELLRALCEGGPGLFGKLCADDSVDELCLTVSPVLIGGTSGRIAATPQAHHVAMTRAHLLADDDGTLLFRWVRTARG